MLRPEWRDISALTFDLRMKLSYFFLLNRMFLIYSVCVYTYLSVEKCWASSLIDTLHSCSGRIYKRVLECSSRAPVNIQPDESLCPWVRGWGLGAEVCWAYNPIGQWLRLKCRAICPVSRSHNNKKTGTATHSPSEREQRDWGLCGTSSRTWRMEVLLSYILVVPVRREPKCVCVCVCFKVKIQGKPWITTVSVSSALERNVLKLVLLWKYLGESSFGVWGLVELLPWGGSV